MTERKLADINFGRRSPVRKFLVFIWIYVLTFGTFLFWKVAHLIGVPDDAVTWMILLKAFLIICGFPLGGALLLFYVVFNAHRFTFTDEGIRVLTWRGVQFFAWNEISEAFLTDLRRNVDLILRAGERRYIIIPLNSFLRSETLLGEIRRRLAVHLWTTERQMNRIMEVKKTFPPS